MPDREKLISANALIEHLDVSIAESKGLIGATCVAIKCYVEQMPAVDMPKWIPVTERLPECVNFLVALANGMVGEAFMMNGDFYWQEVAASWEYEAPIKGVTHWMPLPEAPKEVDHDHTEGNH